MTHRPQDVTLVELRAAGACLTLVLDAQNGPVPVHVPLKPVTMHALRHLHALHAHSGGCHVAVEVHVDLLLCCIGSLGAQSAAVVVRDSLPPAFWLRLLRPCAGETHLDLNILDAVGLLMSRRLPVQLERTGADTDWDAGLREMLRDEGRQGPSS
ncbi:MAG: hypothetical protein GEU81_08830 [Nitriliruptorales bacterium]|nr:hypothetical protein [Nitriliruptorales bacterium]